MVEKQKRRPVMLAILDGWGYRAAREDNAVALAKLPVWTRLMQECPHALVATSGRDVGLPDGQMGNSEVGHMNIGSGRIVYQDLTRIEFLVPAEALQRGPNTLAVSVNRPGPFPPSRPVKLEKVELHLK